MHLLVLRWHKSLQNILQTYFKILQSTSAKAAHKALSYWDKWWVGNYQQKHRKLTDPRTNNEYMEHAPELSNNCQKTLLEDSFPPRINTVDIRAWWQHRYNSLRLWPEFFGMLHRMSSYITEFINTSLVTQCIPNSSNIHARTSFFKKPNVW